MLSDDALNNLMAPVIARQEEINLYVITKIANRIKQIGQVKASDVQQLIRLRHTGADVRLINQELARLTKLQMQDIKNIIRAAALSTYLDAKPFYDYRHKSFIPYKENKYLQREVEAIARQTVGTYQNLSKAQAFMIRDPHDPKKLIPTTLSKTYQTVVDEAIQATQTGVLDYNTSMRRTLTQLSQSGLRRVTYDPESRKTFTQRMDTAVRRNLMDGVRSVNQQVWLITGEEFDADGVEVSAHLYPAPDHAAMQGHQYTKKQFDRMQDGKDFQDVQGRRYTGFKRAVGTLNCYHIARAVILGVMKPTYTDDQLQDMLKANDAGYTLPNGKHLTMYECTQYQRRLETKIRYAKDGQIAARAAGDAQLARDFQARINKYTKQYEQFSNACGLSEKKERMRISGYRKIKATI